MNSRYVTVCVQDTARLYALVQRGREIADRAGCSLKVLLFVSLAGRCEEQAELLEYTFQCARQMNAEMSAFYTDEPMEKLMKDRSECLIVHGGETLTGEILRRMPDRNLVVLE